MQSIIFIGYIFFFNWLVLKIPFIKKSQLPAAWITGLFSLKVIAGLLYAWFYLQPAYYPTSDTWNYFNDSKTEASWLLRDPAGFFRDIFVSGYPERGNLFLSHNSYWNDLRSNILIKLLAISNVFTFSNYYADVILFNFIFFLGQIAFYRLVKAQFPGGKWLPVALVFLIPSLLFWCSGIHKDGLIFSSLGICIYLFDKFLRGVKGKWTFLVGTFIGLAFMFLLRNFVFFLLVPALAGWYLSERYFKGRQLLVFNMIYLGGVILFFTSIDLNPVFNVPLYIIRKQNEFRILQGHQIDLPPLGLSVKSFLLFLPYAIRNALWEPSFGDMQNLSYLPAALENVLILVLVLLGVCCRKRKTVLSPFMLFCIYFSISVLLIIGYTITSPAGIVRYKSLVLPFLLVPLLMNMDFHYFRSIRDFLFSRRGVG